MPKERKRPPGAPWTVRELAEFLAVGRNRIYAGIEAGTIRAIKLGAHSVRVPDSEVSRLLEEGASDAPAGR
jgi:excisionase family DNA binding protein